MKKNKSVCYPGVAKWTTVLVFIISTSMVKSGAGVSITACPLMIMEKTENVVSCTGIATTDTVKWALIKGSVVTSVGECPSPNSCTYTYHIADLSRPSGGVSTMTIKSPTRAVYAGARISCETMSPSRAQTGGDSCEVDVIYPADVTSCNITPVKSDTKWTVSGSCTISKAFSSKGDYFCQLRQQKGTSGDVPTGGKTPYIPTLAGDYVSGTCSYNATLPVDSDTYNYTVLVSPGEITESAGKIDVDAPNAGPAINCGRSTVQYIIENTELDCTCTRTNLGKPEGRLVGYHDNTLLVRGQYGVSSLTLPTVTASRQMGQVIVRCVVDWATSDTQDKSAIFTVPVAYGPDTVNLTDPEVFDLNPAPLGTVTLTCTASSSNPGVTYSWSRSCEVVTLSNTCSFTPTVNDHNTSITCTVTNTAAQVTRTASRTITLNWPPPTAPSLSGYNGQPLYTGQSLTITCAVDGGNPKVSKVKISCGNRTWEVSGQNSTAQLQVDASFNGVMCTCGGSWKIPTWYTQTVNVTIVVYYAPKTPNITYTNHPLPFMAGDKPTLICQLPGNTDHGNPPAILTWNDQQGQQGQGNIKLIVGPLAAKDNGRKIQCEASNDFTVKSNSRVLKEINLIVYYGPDVRVSPLLGNQCVISSTSNTCIVSEGERVYVNCTANSNPAAANITWTKSRDSILDFTANRTTDVTQHCTATTGSMDGDSRLPLNNSLDLSVLVTYGSALESLTINNHQNNLTVTEGSGFNITCNATGRPTPAITLYRYRTSLEPFLLQGYVTADQAVTLSHAQDAATCEMTGPYTCEVNNDLAVKTSRTTHLFVNCKPRNSVAYPPKTPTVNYVNTPQEQSFNLVAYPVPDNFTFSYLGSSLNNRSQTAGPVTSNTLQMKCFPTDFLYNVTCSVTVDNITSEREAGLYGVNVSNAFGHVLLEFMITFNASNSQYEGLSIGAAIGGGIAAAVVVVIVAVSIIIFIRRRRKGSEGPLRGRSKEKKSDKIKLAAPNHSGASSTHDEAVETDENTHKKPTAVISPKRKSKSRIHHGKSDAVYENIELNRPARHRKEEHSSSTSAEHSTLVNLPMSASLNNLNNLSTADHQSTINASEDDHANRSANTHTASPAVKKHSQSPPAHRTHDVPAKQHSSPKHSCNSPASLSTHTEMTPADADDCEEMEPADDTKASEAALYNDVEYMTSQEATLGLDHTQQYLLDKLRGNHLNEEFGKLPAGHQRDCNVGSMGENRSKNRFNGSILPYDANRVALLGESNDYINASRIRGYSSSTSYIAAQGPKKNTVIDFWKMVWQENITHIVMLTNLTEGEKIKCVEYWPQHGKHIRYGSVIVTSIDTFRRANCVVRTFEIKGSGDGPSRHVSQYHFITWLDHSVPSATALVDFWRTVTTSHRNQTSPSPLLVHCSAGVGRTGTFIALDIAIDTIREGAEINIFHIIQHMREDRVNMVQTVSQYRFVHEAILEAYTSRHARLALLAFNSFFPNDIDPNKHIDKIDHEFKLLNQMKVLLHKPSHTVASSSENLKSNRTVIFPDDNHLVYLSTFAKGRNQYINAVLMPTFFRRRDCMLTQLPLQNTLVDIWRLVDGNDVTTIVSIGAEVDGTEVKCCYWPRKDGEITKFGPFTITLKSKTTLGKHLTSYELSYQLKNSTDSRKVSLLQYRGWTGEVPDSTQDLLQLVDLVNSRSVRNHEDEEDKEAGSVVVQCLDGATKSGLFRVICDVVSRMTYDHDVDVYMAVRHVQIVRPESVTSEVQYRYIYYVIQEYQRRNAVYNN